MSPPATLVASTGKASEVVELVDDFAGVWTIVLIGVSRASGTGRSKDSIVAEAVKEDGSPAPGDVLPIGGFCT